MLLHDDAQDYRSVPTRENMIRAMQWLVNGASKDDALFFHYSGHGTLTADVQTGDDDEAICPVDFQQGGLIINHECERRLGCTDKCMSCLCVHSLPAAA